MKEPVHSGNYHGHGYKRFDLMQQNNDNQTDTQISSGKALSNYYKAKRDHTIYGVVSFALSAVFYLNFMAPDWLSKLTSHSSWTEIIQTLIYILVGLMFVTALTLGIMRSHTSNNPKIHLVRVLILLGLVFNVFTETSSTMDRVDERVAIKSTQSEVYKALTQRIKNGSTGGNAALIEAQKNYADAKSTADIRCAQKGRKAKRLCDKWTMRTNEYQITIDLLKKQTHSELKETTTQAKEAEHDSSYAQAVIKLIMERLGLSFLMATLAVTGFIVCTFEMFGFFMGNDLKRYESALQQHGINIYRNSELKAETARMKAELKAEQKKANLDKKKKLFIFQRGKVEPQDSVADKISGAVKKGAEQGLEKAIPAVTAPLAQAGAIISKPAAPATSLAPHKLSSSKLPSKAEQQKKIKKIRLDKSFMTVINRPDYKKIAVAVISGKINPSQPQLKKATDEGLGGSTAETMLRTFEIMGIISGKQNNGQRKALLTLDEAKATKLVSQFISIVKEQKEQKEQKDAVNKNTKR